ncbi:unnamed protein product [Lathyrus sativus]|nr:unnamed protein product [Lathyrus sativus]
MDELRVILEGLMFTLDLGFRRVEVNTNSFEIARDLSLGRSIRSDGLEMLRKIESLLSRFDEAIVSHTYRETNMCADALAKFGCRLSSDMACLSSAPSFIKRLSWGFPPLRRCSCSVFFFFWAFGLHLYKKKKVNYRDSIHPFLIRN